MTWNVRGDGKINNIVKEMNRLYIDMMGVRKAHWIGCSEVITSGFQLNYLASASSQYRDGVLVNAFNPQSKVSTAGGMHTHGIESYLYSHIKI